MGGGSLVLEDGVRGGSEIRGFVYQKRAQNVFPLENLFFPLRNFVMAETICLTFFWFKNDAGWRLFSQTGACAEHCFMTANLQIVIARQTDVREGSTE